MTTSDAAALTTHVVADRSRIFADLSAMCRFNSVHGDPEVRPDYDASAQWVADAFNQAGIDVELVACCDDSTAIVGHRPAKNGAPTVLLYAHHDIVPVGPEADWDADPLQVTPRDHDGVERWHARGTADCKGNIAMHLASLRALDAAGISPDTGIKVVIEGSEENGGAGLSDLLATQPELFAADAIFIADTGNATTGVPSLVTVLRGSAQLKVTCDTLESGAHSGKFGGGAPDAVAALMRALDSLRDESGRTVIDGIDCTGTWAGQAYPVDKFRSDAGVLDGVRLAGGADDGDVAVADLVWARPAVTVTGFTSTPVADAVNAVPATASAQLNLRVPPGLIDADGSALSCQQAAEKLAEHVRAHAPWGARITVDIEDASTPFAADPNGPALGLLRDCLTDAYGTQAVAIGTGGSIPLTVELAGAFPDADIALFGVADTSAAIHSPSESVDPTEIERMAIAQALFIARFSR